MYIYIFILFDIYLLFEEKQNYKVHRDYCYEKSIHVYTFLGSIYALCSVVCSESLDVIHVNGIAQFY